MHSPNEHPIESRGSDSRHNQRPATDRPTAPQIRAADLNPPAGRRPVALPADVNVSRGYTSHLERYRPVDDFNRQPQRQNADPWVVTR